MNASSFVLGKQAWSKTPGI